MEKPYSGSADNIVMYNEAGNIIDCQVSYRTQEELNDDDAGAVILHRQKGRMWGVNTLVNALAGKTAQEIAALGAEVGTSTFENVRVEATLNATERADISNTLENVAKGKDAKGSICPGCPLQSTCSSTFKAMVSNLRKPS